MSFKALAWAFDQELPNPQKAVLVALAYRDNHDEPHGCFPSLARVAQDCGLSRSTVVRCVRTLVSIGLVHRAPRRDPHGDQTTSWYTFPEVWGVVSHSTYPGSHSAYPGAHSTYGGVTQHLGVVSHSTTEPKALTGTERKTGPQEARPAPPPSSPPPSNSEPGSPSAPSADEQKHGQRNFLAEMRRIAEGKSL